MIRAAVVTISDRGYRGEWEDASGPLLGQLVAEMGAQVVAAPLIFPLGFIVPHWLGRFAFNRGQRIAITYSSGMKNLPIAVGLAFASFGKLAGLPVALAFIVQMLTAGLFYRYLNRQVAPAGAPGPRKEIV